MIPRKSKRFRKGELDYLLAFQEIYEGFLAGQSLEKIAKNRIAAAKKEDPSGPRRPRTVKTELNHIQRVIRVLSARYEIDLLGGQRNETNGLVPTEDGRKLFERATEVRNAYENIFSPTVRHVVRISTIDAGCNFWIPEALAAQRFFKKKANRSIDIHIQVREWWEVIRDLTQGAADFGIATDLEDRAVDRELLLCRGHRAVLHKKHPLRNASKIKLQDLGDKTVVCLHDFVAPVGIASHLRAIQVPAQIILVNTVAQIISWVQHRQAIGFVTKDMVPKNAPLITLPVEPELVEAKDAVYFPKARRKKGRQRLSEHAEKVLLCILDHWNPKHTYERSDRSSKG